MPGGGALRAPPLYIFVDLFFIYQDINLKLSVNSYFFVSDQMKVVSKTSDPYKGKNRGVKVGGGGQDFFAIFVKNRKKII